MSIPPSLSPEILQSCIRGKRKALEQFYSHYYARIYRVCFIYLREEEDSKDAASMSFVKIFDNLHGYDASLASLNTWMRRIAVNICIDMLRKRKTFQLLDLEHLPEIPISPEFDAGIDFREISRYIEKMDSPLKEILKLHSLDGYSHKEIAEILGISEKYSRVALCLAKKRLVTHFKSYEPHEQHRR